MKRVLEHLRLMARNNAYANEMLHEACGRLGPGEFTAERTGFFPSISATLNHILAVDRYYLDAMKEEGEGRRLYSMPQIENAEALKTAQAETDSVLIGFCDGLSEEDLDRAPVQDRGEKGQFRETIGDTLLHLFQHQIHHRGQVHAMLSSTSVAPPQLDDFFLDYGRHPVAQRHRETF